MKRRESRGRRAPTEATSRRTVLVYCGAARTEPDYFEGLKAALLSTTVTVKVRREAVSPDRLLHHADCRSHCNDCADVVSRLKRHVSTYDKTSLRFADHADGVVDAVKRAKEMDPTGMDFRRNPSTGIWRLVRTITATS